LSASECEQFPVGRTCKTTEGHSEFAVDLIGRNHGLDDNGEIRRQESRDSLIGVHSIKAHWNVTALGVDLANVQFGDAVSKVCKEFDGDTHCRINLAGMADVETESGFRKACEKTIRVASGPAYSFSLVDVFQQNPIAKFPPRSEIRDDIGVDDDGRYVLTDAKQLMN
jgi:hypothetical protein